MYLFLDTETAGLKPAQPLLSAAFILTDDTDKEIDRLVLKVKSEGIPSIDVEAMAVNKIDLVAHWKIALLPKAAAVEFLKFLNKNGVSKLNTTMVGHNIEFDLAFIYEYLMDEKTVRMYFNKYKEDTGIIAKFLKLKFGKLAELAAALKIDISDLEAHTEVGDTEITRRCYWKMHDMVHGDINGQETNS